MQTTRFLPLLALCGAAAAQWHQATTATTPPDRFYTAMTYDAQNGRTLLFGGSPAVGLTPRSDTWAFRDSTWTQLSPTTSPPGRGGMEMVYDSLRQVVVMYGGLNASPFGGHSRDDTWEFNGTTWTQVATTTTPGGWGWYGMAYDSARNVTVLYGGMADNGLVLFPNSNQTWEYNGINWTLRAPATNPGPLENPAMCYHAGLGKVILFGGIDVFNGGTNTTWGYDGTNWAPIAVAGTPPGARTLAKMVYDTSRNVCVMTGGMDQTGTLINETWEFNGLTWLQITPHLPTARRGAGFAYDGGRFSSVMFGGVTQTFGALTDTWDFGQVIESFGSGCPGTNGPVGFTTTSGARVGRNFTATMTNMFPGAPLSVFVYGFSDTFDGAIPLPLDLSIVGMNGCTQYHSKDMIEFDGVSGTTASHTVAVPNTGAFLGMRYFMTGGSPDPINSFFLVLTKPKRGFVGL